MRQLMAKNMENLPPVALPREQVTEGLPTLSGRVTMYQTFKGKTHKIRAVLKVYDSFDSYAVLSQDKAVGKDCGCFSLKNFTFRVVPAKKFSREYRFEVVPRNCEGTVMTFSTSSKQETAKWVEDLSRLAGPVDLAPVTLRVNLRTVLRPVSPRSSMVGSNKRSSLLHTLEEGEESELSAVTE